MQDPTGRDEFDEAERRGDPIGPIEHVSFRTPPPGVRAPQATPRSFVDRPTSVPDRNEPVAHGVSSMHSPHRDRKLVLAISIAVLLLLAAGWFAYAAHTNNDAARDWKQRSIELEEQVNGLRTLIGERSAELNERTRQANRIAANLRSTRTALRRSEGDVSSLAQRQRELANDKAQLEDERRALQQQAGDLAEIAGRYIACKSSLVDVINALIDEDYSSASYEIDIANSRCDSAASALNAYVAAYE